MSVEALLIIDVQKALIHGAFRENETLAAIRTATDELRRRNAIIVYVQHCHTTFEPMKRGEVGWQLDNRLDVQECDLIIEKEASDAFYETQLDDWLRGRGVDHLYVAGLQTEYCVDATCRSALSKGYQVTLVKDGHTTGDSVLPAAQVINHHNALLANLAHPKNQIHVVESTSL